MPSLPLSNHKKIKSVSFSQSGQINGHTKFVALPKTKEILLNWLMIGTYVLMRVLLCKIQCPSFICFCKPSPHIYASGSLKLEDTPPPPPPPPPPPQVSSVVDDGDDDDQFVDAQVEEVVDHVDGLLNEAREEEGKEEDCALEEGQSNGEILKSSLKKKTLDSEDGERREKKKVQWVDLMGKELAEIREFESSEEEEIRYDGDRSCVCVIL